MFIEVHVCVGSYMCMCVEVYACAYGEQRSTSNVIPQELATLIFETGSLIGLELDKPCCVASEPQGSICLSLPRAKLISLFLKIIFINSFRMSCNDFSS